MTSSRFEFDLFDPDQTQNMWDLMKEMRQTCPVAEPAAGFLYTARYEDTQRVFRDARTFSCKGGFRAPGVEIPDEELMMAEMDPPLHPKIRKFVLSSFNPGMAKGAEPFTRDYIRARFDELEATDGGDLMAMVASPIPLAVTGHVLGVPLEDISELSGRFFDLMHTDWPAYGVHDRTQPDEGRGIEGSAPELAAYFAALIRARRQGELETDDLLSQLGRAEIDGQQLSDGQIRGLAINYLSAGLSTANLIGNLAYRIITDHQFHQRLAEEPSRIPLAIEESLRFEPPVLFLFRTTAERATIGDTSVEPGARIVMGIASANRDETKYDHADEYFLDRDEPPEHLAFGAGPHLCLGNHLARMEATVFLQEYLARYGQGDVELAKGYEFELMPHFLEYGPESLDVVVRRD
jgi:cytochrome P450